MNNLPGRHAQPYNATSEMRPNAENPQHRALNTAQMLEPARSLDDLDAILDDFDDWGAVYYDLNLTETTPLNRSTFWTDIPGNLDTTTIFPREHA